MNRLSIDDIAEHFSQQSSFEGAALYSSVFFGLRSSPYSFKNGICKYVLFVFLFFSHVTFLFGELDKWGKREIFLLNWNQKKKPKNPPKQEYSKTQKVTRGGNFESERRDGSVRTNCFHFYDVAPDFVFFPRFSIRGDVCLYCLYLTSVVFLDNTLYLNTFRCLYLYYGLSHFPYGSSFFWARP